jgi:multidrug efflux system membrane fusion protein
LGFIKKGNEASVKIDAYPSETFKGIINNIAEAADPVTGSYEIEVKVVPNDKKFAPAFSLLFN